LKTPRTLWAAEIAGLFVKVDLFAVGTLYAMSTLMMTMLIVIGTVWFIGAFVFCLALAKAAGRPIPSLDDTSELSEFTTEFNYATLSSANENSHDHDHGFQPAVVMAK
jgi:hypothetical protein